MGRYQNSGAGTGTFDIKVLSQVGHSLPPAEFHAHFNDSEDMLLGREVSVLFSFRKRHYKEVCKYASNYVRNGLSSDMWGNLYSVGGTSLGH